MRGLSYSDLKRYDEALEDFGRAIELDPTYPKPYYNRGNGYWQLDDYGAALADYLAVTKLEPGFSSTSRRSRIDADATRPWIISARRPMSNATINGRNLLNPLSTKSGEGLPMI